MARKAITDRSPLALHYSEFLGRLIDRDIGSRSGRKMTPLEGRSGTYWVEHAFPGAWGQPKPLALADLVLLADSFKMDPYDFVAAVNDDDLAAIPRHPSSVPGIYLVSGVVETAKLAARRTRKK